MLAHRSIAPAIDELQEPRRAWSSSKGAVMEWATHFWDVARWPAEFPYAFEEVLLPALVRGVPLLQADPAGPDDHGTGQTMSTLTLPGADIRGYYYRLGIRLSETSSTAASVRCFADPSAHRREDRDPSCAVNVVNGAWQCHGCGARGGAYDAALAKGHTPRAAIDLMITHGLIERGTRLRTARELLRNLPRPPIDPPGLPAQAPAREGLASRPVLNACERDIARWQTALSHRPTQIARLARDRGWRYQTMREAGARA